jgi:hypothetical protein
MMASRSAIASMTQRQYACAGNELHSRRREIPLVSSLRSTIPGRDVVLARRQGSTWFIGAMTAEDRVQKVSLRFLPRGKYRATVWEDGATANDVRRSERTVTSRDASIATEPTTARSAIRSAARTRRGSRSVARRRRGRNDRAVEIFYRGPSWVLRVHQRGVPNEADK